VKEIYLFSKQTLRAWYELASLLFLLGTGGCLPPGIRRLGREVDSLPPAVAETRSRWSIGLPRSPDTRKRGHYLRCNYAVHRTAYLGIHCKFVLIHGVHYSTVHKTHFIRNATRA